jgi:hypothetical protein
MSTNAIIKIEGINYACLYKHWDGDVPATLPWLSAFNDKWTRKDNGYKFAQLVRSSLAQAEEFRLDDSTDTGWGIIPLPDECVDYIYTLKENGQVTVQRG